MVEGVVFCQCKSISKTAVEFRTLELIRQITREACLIYLLRKILERLAGSLKRLYKRNGLHVAVYRLVVSARVLNCVASPNDLPQT